MNNDDSGFLPKEFGEAMRATSEPETEIERYERGLELLREARDLLKDAPKTAARIRLAITSAKGAVSNARYRAGAAARGESRKRIKRTAHDDHQPALVAEVPKLPRGPR